MIESVKESGNLHITLFNVMQQQGPKLSESIMANASHYMPKQLMLLQAVSDPFFACLQLYMVQPRAATALGRRARALQNDLATYVLTAWQGWAARRAKVGSVTAINLMMTLSSANDVCVHVGQLCVSEQHVLHCSLA